MKWKLILFLTSIAVLLGLILSCNSTYTTKKKGYYKVDFPSKEYRLFHQDNFPYSFEYPVYANIVKDSTYFDKNLNDPYWIQEDRHFTGAP